MTKGEERVKEGAIVGGAMGSVAGPKGTATGAVIGAGANGAYHVYETTGAKKTVSREANNAKKSVGKVFGRKW
eukprot:CAMPEP_0194057950 /NCGR_PEP_ID=MMETSP0009_2-20130614/64760_1 /TAXON_ID=210454 /ORGANISM="Grammatophora oceanica, Strain CCMP 410" /LENGTH=72 /DNA_ID=CAMNT_0038707895 /DNA_START=331 /DNA_END=549 /DNA_ORIENTATION=-